MYIFQEQPVITIGSNHFRNVPILIQVEDVPLLEVVKSAKGGYTTKFAVYDTDGNQIAKVKGSQMYVTEHGKKAKLTPRFEPFLTVFEVEGKPILELRRDRAAALKGWAELHAPGGTLIKALDVGVSGLFKGGTALQVGGAIFTGSRVSDLRIGIHVTGDKILFGIP